MIAAALAFALAASGPVLDSDGLRRFEERARKAPEQVAGPASFRLEFPIVPDRKTDLASLQSPAGYSYDRASAVLTIDVDFGAITPENYRLFDRQGLAKAPPLRTFFFDTRTTRANTYHTVLDEHGDTSTNQGWSLEGTSYGIAVAASAKAYGTRGGDLPDDFILPFFIKAKLPPQAVGAFVHNLRLRVEGELRTIQGLSVLCSLTKGDGYVADEFTQKTPNVITEQQCLAPAAITRVSLVRVTGGPPLKTWTRSASELTAEGADTAVIMAGTRDRAAPSLLQPQEASSPNATAPLPKRP